MDQRYLNMIRRWLWVVLLATLIAGGTTYWISLQQPVFYEAQARLIVGPGIDSLNPELNDLRTGGQLLQTYAELATSRPVLQHVVDRLGLNVTTVVLEHGITVRADQETQFLSVKVQDGNPTQAATIANAIADRLVELSPSSPGGSAAQLQERMSDQARRIEDNIASIEGKIVQLEYEFDSTNDITQKRIISDELSQQRIRLVDAHATLALLYDSLQKASTNKVRLVEPAIEGEEVSSQTNLKVIIGALAGLILSISVVLVFEFFDEATVKTTEGAGKLTKLPTLVGIGEIRTNEDALVTISQPRSPISEAYRVLRTSIQFSSVDNPNRTLLVTSSIPGEGKSTTAANLAVVMAQAGHNVLLVDTDLRRPAQDQIFELPNRRGLTSLLLEFNVAEGDHNMRALLNDVVQETRVEGLHLLSSGPVPPNPSELLGSTKMKTLLHALGNAYDYVILDSPAVLAATDAAVLSVLADGTLVTALAGKSRKTHLSQAVEQLREVNANLMGVILNGLSAKSDSYGMYYREASSSYNVNASAPKRGWFGRSRDKQKKAAPKAKTVTAGKSAD